MLIMSYVETVWNETKIGSHTYITIDSQYCFFFLLCIWVRGKYMGGGFCIPM